jgi:hypothetical protein
MDWLEENGFFRVGSRLDEGATPIEPARAAARSDRMSMCRLVPTIVSRDVGLFTIRTVIAGAAFSILLFGEEGPYHQPASYPTSRPGSLLKRSKLSRPIAPFHYASNLT